MPMLFAYDAQAHDTPAPFLPIQISHPSQPEHTLEVIAKIDTGADISAIPRHIATALALEETGELKVAGFDGPPSSYTICAVRIALPSGQRARLNALVVPSDDVILGRDVLNHLRLLLDGPALTSEILPPAEGQVP